MTTLAKLKRKDAEIYEKDKNFFEDKDFEHESVLLGKRGNQSSKYDKKKLTYKDQVRMQALAGELGNSDSDNDEDNFNSKKQSDMTPYELEQAQKNEFKKAAAWGKQDESGSEEEDFLVKKKKSRRMIEDEEDEFKRFVSIKKSENKKDAKILKKAFGKPENMENDDLWLRNFILKRAWVDNDDIEYADSNNMNNFRIDKEDIEKESEVSPQFSKNLQNS